MRVPESITDRLPALTVLEEDWEPVSPWALGAWVVFYLVLLAGAAGGGGLARWFDLVFVPIHEGGHLLFRWFGNTWIMVAGGTGLQLFVPFALAVYFVFRRQMFGAAFCAFFFFEQFLPIATYMADARCECLTYVTVGDPDNALHDFNYLFSSVGLLDHDTQIGMAVRVMGWMGMIGVTAWLVWCGWPRRVVSSSASPTDWVPPPFAQNRRELGTPVGDKPLQAGSFQRRLQFPPHN